MIPHAAPVAALEGGPHEGTRVRCAIRVAGLCLLLLTACASPEAVRNRGGPGADVGNRRKTVEIHAGARPYYKTLCVTEPVQCKGPPPVFGPTPPPD